MPVWCRRAAGAPPDTGCTTSTPFLRLDLVRTLRALGLPLDAIRALLTEKTSMAEIASAHADALDFQISTMRLQRAVLRAAAKTTTTHPPRLP